MSTPTTDRPTGAGPARTRTDTRTDPRVEARRALARRLMLWSVPVAAMVLLVLGRVVVLDVNNGAGLTAYGQNRQAEAQRRFEQNDRLNPFQRWVSPFNAGGARYRAGDLAGAVAAFERALPLAPQERVCTVRVNLAMSREGIGDRLAASDRAAATAQWTRAREDLRGCDTPQSRQEDAQLRRKLEDESSSSSPSPSSSSSSQSPSPSTSSASPSSQSPSLDPSKSSALGSYNSSGASVRATSTRSSGTGGDGTYHW